MRITDIRKRQDRLLYEVAKAKSFEVGPWHDLRIVREASKWVSGNYSFDATIKGDTQLAKDLEELARCKLVNFGKEIVYPDASRSLNPNPDKWIVRLTAEGLERAQEYEKPWWVKAYEKQPVTAWQVLITALLTVGGIFVGYYLGKRP